MDRASVLDVIDGDGEDCVDYENCYDDDDDDVEEGELRSTFGAMDIAEEIEERECQADVASSRLELRVVTTNGSASDLFSDAIVGGASTNEFQNGAGLGFANSPHVGRNGVTVGTKKQRRIQRRKQGKESAQRKPFSIDKFVVETCRRLQETKFPLFREAVDRIGVERIQTLLREVEVIEKCGGQLTADGGRRRTPGGVLWNILKEHVGADMYKDIMKEGNRKYLERQKERQKERGNGKRQGGTQANDQQHNMKRAKMEMCIDAPRHRRPPRPQQEFFPDRVSVVCPVETDDLRAPVQVQNAWVQGLKPQPDDEVTSNEDMLSKQHTIMGRRIPGVASSKLNISERIRMPVSYGDLVEDIDGSESHANGSSEQVGSDTV